MSYKVSSLITSGQYQVSKRENEKFIRSQKLTLLNNQWIKEITREVRKYLDLSMQAKTQHNQNFKNSVEVILKEKYMAVNPYIKK